MTCAKKEVSCVIRTAEGKIFYGSNNCLNPQPTCPRLPGEGYEKCRSICKQPDHAELVALAAAQADNAVLHNGIATLHGNNYYCKDCMRALYKAGIRVFVIGDT